MMKQLRGRNLAHPGCLIGVTAGLSLGILVAGILAIKFNTPYNTVLLIWFGMTLGLAIIGWLVGSALSSRFPALPENEPSENMPSEEMPSTSEIVATSSSLTSSDSKTEE